MGLGVGDAKGHASIGCCPWAFATCQALGTHHALSGLLLRPLDEGVGVCYHDQHKHPHAIKALSLRKAKKAAQDHIARKWQSQNFNQLYLIEASSLPRMI